MKRRSTSPLRFETLEVRTNPDGDLVGAGTIASGHVDIFEIEFEAAEGPDSPAKLEVVLHHEDLDEEFSPDGTTFVVNPDARTTRPAGDAFNFLGVAAGQPVWVLPQIQDPRLVYPGISAEEIEIGTLGRYLETDPRINTRNEFIRLELVSFDGPGEMSIYSIDPFGRPVVFMQTADGVQAAGTPSDTLFVTPGSHIHHNFAFTAPGEYTVQVQAKAFLSDDQRNPIESEVVTYSFFVQEGQASTPPKIRNGLVAIAPDPGSSPIVRLVNPITGGEIFQIQAYEDSFRGGVNVALGDITGDGLDDIITGAGAGGGPRIEVFDGASGKSLGSFFAYEPTFTGGVAVALGDINGDGVLDIITGAGPGGGPRVVAFDGQDLNSPNRRQLANFFAYEPTYTGGVNIAAGDYDGDGQADIAIGSGVGGGPRVVVVRGSDQAVLRNFFAYESSFRGGVNVNLVDLDDDGKADILAGSGVGGGPRVRAILNQADDDDSFLDFFAYSSDERGGVRVTAVDSNGDDELEIITASGSTGRVARFTLDAEELNDFFAIEDRLGVRVSGSPKRD